MNLSSADQALLHRFHDDELPAAEAAAFRVRLEAEPTLRAALAELEELRRGSAGGRDRVFSAPAGFTARLLAEVRRLPDRIALREAEASARAAVMCRRILLAATVLFGLGLCWQAGLFDFGRPSRLEAAPGEIEREMERLDAIAHDLPPAQERR